MHGVVAPGVSRKHWLYEGLLGVKTSMERLVSRCGTCACPCAF